MNNQEVYRRNYSKWIDNLFVQQQQLFEELIGQVIIEIRYTNELEGWDIDIQDESIIHIPMGFVNFKTEKGGYYRIITNFQSYQGGYYGILLEKYDEHELMTKLHEKDVNHYDQSIWEPIHSQTIQKIEWNWKSISEKFMEGKEVTRTQIQQILYEKDLVLDNLIIHFSYGRKIFFFALEPDNKLEDKNTYYLLSGGEELMIFFDEEKLVKWDITTFGFKIKPATNKAQPQS